MTSRRIPADHAPNAWASRLTARRESGAPLHDLTLADPARTGLSRVSAEAAASLAAGALAPHQPDPRGLPAARAAVAEYFESRGQAVSPERIVLTSGTSEAYAHLFRLLADPGDRVLVPAPSYPLFEPLAALEGVRLASYPLAYDGRWHLDAPALEAAFRGGARAMIAVQPNHPSGSCLTPDEIAAAEALCERAGAAIISDEVFGDFAWDGRPRGLPSLLGERRVPTFVLGGLSKACGLPQLKLSWIAACGPAAAVGRALSGLEWIADLFLSVAAPAQHALPALLAGRHEYRRGVMGRVAANRASLAALVKRTPALSVLAAEGGWHAVLRLPSRRSEDEWMSALLDAGVIVHPGHFYDFASEAFAVVSLISDPATFAAGLSAIERVAGAP
jgi:aspartate/methionine/tyrosine aminotransferase